MKNTNKVYTTHSKFTPIPFHAHIHHQMLRSRGTCQWNYQTKAYGIASLQIQASFANASICSGIIATSIARTRIAKIEEVNKKKIGKNEYKKK